MRTTPPRSQREENIEPGSEVFEAKMEEFSTRMTKYRKDKLYPVLPVWEVFCFYPMTKRRAPGQNWYALPFARAQEAHGRARPRRPHVRTGRSSSSSPARTGLDDAEWGVTLFAHDYLLTSKDIVYKMRFDEVSAQYADFGEFFIGAEHPARRDFPPPPALRPAIGARVSFVRRIILTRKHESTKKGRETSMPTASPCLVTISSVFSLHNSSNHLRRLSNCLSSPS